MPPRIAPTFERTFLGTQKNTNGTSTSHYMDPSGSRDLLAGSEGHYGYPNFPPNRDVGGGFSLFDDTTDHQRVGVNCVWLNDPSTNYNGSMMSRRPTILHPDSSGNGSSRGAEAYAKMKPTRPSMRLLTSIYELKDLPSMLRQRMTNNNLKNIGSYFLAYKFGWEPLFQDIRDMVVKQKTIEKRIDWLLRHNNKAVRTRITLANFSENAVTRSGGPGSGILHPQLATQYFKVLPAFKEVEQFSEHWWASARWRIHLPAGPGNIAYKRALMAELYGLYPSPSTIWKMMPWSWLIDWFSNAGYLIENLETTMDSRIAADYMYMMRENRITSSYEAWATLYDRNMTPFEVRVGANRRRTWKSRLVGNPFGFSTNTNLSGMQMAILGALGASRL